MKLHIIHENDKIDFTLIRRSNIRHIYLSIDKNSGVTIKAHPRFSRQSAESFIREKAQWIKEKQRLIRHSITTSLPSLENMVHLYIGGKRQVVTLAEDPKRHRIRIDHGEDTLSIHYHPEKPHTVAPAIERFYKRLTESLILERLPYWAEQMQLFPSEVTFHKFRRRWGSCDHKNRLRFNTLLSQFEEEVIDYIIVHELAHIQVKNHSKTFWDLVSRYQPDYKSIHHRIAAPRSGDSL